MMRCRSGRWKFKFVAHSMQEKNGANKPASSQTLEFRLSDYIKTILFLILLLWLIWLTLKVSLPAGMDQPCSNEGSAKIVKERNETERIRAETAA